jgi:hypothetical protein
LDLPWIPAEVVLVGAIAGGSVVRRTSPRNFSAAYVELEHRRTLGVSGARSAAASLPVDRRLLAQQIMSAREAPDKYSIVQGDDDVVVFSRVEKLLHGDGEVLQ